MNHTAFPSSYLKLCPKLAVEIGLNQAFLVAHLDTMISSSSSGHTQKRIWIRKSLSSWQKDFPFWGEATLRRILKQLVDRGLFMRGDFNEDPFDQTPWWSIDYAQLSNVGKIPQS